MLESNYCRNPDADSEGPWCFIGTGTGEYGYCELPVCGTCYHFNSFIYKDIQNTLYSFQNILKYKFKIALLSKAYNIISFTSLGEGSY